MSPDDLVHYASQALIVCLLVSAPAVVSSAVTGLLVAFVQAITSLQDQSIAYGIKLMVVSLVLVLSAEWAGAQLLMFSKTLFTVAFQHVK
jgi:type III secretion protein S